MSDKLGVGISEDIILKGAELDNNNWLNITFKQLQEVEYNAFDALNADEVVDRPVTELTIKLFNPKVPKDTDNKGNSRSKEKIVELIVNDINRTKAILVHLLKGYLTKDQIKWDIYRATGLDKDNFNARIADNSLLDQIHKNMCSDFINMAKPFFNNEDHKFRLLLLRQSKDKHFPSFRDRYLDENPFWEDMSIPAAASKVKFSDYEKKEGLNDPTPTARTAADAKTTEGSAPTEVTADTVFG